MFGFDDARGAHQEVYGSGGYENQAKFSHELIAGAAAFEGMKKWEDHQRGEGKPVSHKFAKELLAGFVGGEVDKLAETKGMDEYQAHEAKKRGREHAERMYDDHYHGQDEWNPDRRGRPNFNY